MGGDLGQVVRLHQGHRLAGLPSSPFAQETYIPNLEQTRRFAIDYASLVVQVEAIRQIPHMPIMDTSVQIIIDQAIHGLEKLTLGYHPHLIEFMRQELEQIRLYLNTRRADRIVTDEAPVNFWGEE